MSIPAPTASSSSAWNSRDVASQFAVSVTSCHPDRSFNVPTREGGSEVEGPAVPDKQVIRRQPALRYVAANASSPDATE